MLTFDSSFSDTRISTRDPVLYSSESSTCVDSRYGSLGRQGRGRVDATTAGKGAGKRWRRVRGANETRPGLQLASLNCFRPPSKG
jgi:hypothetical protein